MTPVQGTTVGIPTADGVADAYLSHPEDGNPRPAVLLYQDAFGLRPHLKSMADRLAVGQRADFTVFDLVDGDLEATDSNGDVSRLTRLFEPRYAVIGTAAIAASRYVPRPRRLVRHSHGLSWR